MSDFKAAWLFPDTLFLHGERGNLLALARFAQIAGLEPEIVKIDFKTNTFNPFDYEILFFAPGEISSFPKVIKWLEPFKRDLNSYIQSGKPLLVTGTTVALFGKKIKRTDGTIIEGLGLLDIEYSEKESVYADDLYYMCKYNDKKMEIVGTQVQMGDIELNGEEAFGEIEYGYGNNGNDKFEGITKFNSIFTNTLGPILINNPWLCVEIIKLACEHSGIELKKFNYDDKREKASLKSKKNFIFSKETPLKNHK